MCAELFYFSLSALTAAEVPELRNCCGQGGWKPPYQTRAQLVIDSGLTGQCCWVTAGTSCRTTSQLLILGFWNWKLSLLLHKTCKCHFDRELLERFIFGTENTHNHIRSYRRSLPWMTICCVIVAILIPSWQQRKQSRDLQRLHSRILFFTRAPLTFRAFRPGWLAGLMSSLWTETSSDERAKKQLRLLWGSNYCQALKYENIPVSCAATHILQRKLVK